MENKYGDMKKGKIFLEKGKFFILTTKSNAGRKAFPLSEGRVGIVKPEHDAEGALVERG